MIAPRAPHLYAPAAAIVYLIAAIHHDKTLENSGRRFSMVDNLAASTAMHNRFAQGKKIALRISRRACFSGLPKCFRVGKHFLRYCHSPSERSEG